jgi:hypothetical protein
MNNKQWNPVVAVLGSFCLAGCTLFARPGEGPPAVPVTRGTWTGRIVPMTVRDHRGVEHAAAALEVFSGPKVRTWFHPGEGIEYRGPNGEGEPPPGSPLRVEVPAELGSGRLPLIVRGERNSPERLVIPAEELPIGSVVRFSGSMMMSPATIRGTRYGTVSVSRIIWGRSSAASEHVLCITHDPGRGATAGPR